MQKPTHSRTKADMSMPFFVAQYDQSSFSSGETEIVILALGAVIKIPFANENPNYLFIEV
mgnify:CR=1